MDYPSLRLSKTWFLCSLATVIPHSVFAEEAVPIEESIETITVTGYVADKTSTGSKMDLPVQEIPQTISIVTQAQIRNQAAQSLDQALGYTTGIASTTGGARKTTDEVFSLRGFDDRSSSTVYVDGSKMSRNIFSGTTEPYALERVEVLKGPASALYGRAAPGGIINLINKRPTNTPVREMQLSGGTNDRIQFAADFGGALNASETLSARLTGIIRDAKTDVDHINDNRQFLAAAINWEITDSTSLLVRAEYKKDNTIYSYGLPSAGSLLPNPNGAIARNRFIGEPDFDKWDSENIMLSYQLEHEFNDTFTIRQNFHTFDANADYNYIGFGVFVPGVGSFLWADPEMTTLHRNFIERQDDDKSFSVDTSLRATFDTGIISHKLLAGFDYIDGDFKRQQSRGILGSDPFDDTNTINLFDPVYEPSIIDPTLTSARTIETSGLQQTGIYLQDHMTIAENWVISAGIRHDKVTLDSGYEEPDNGDSEAFTEKSDATTFNAGLVYLFENGLSPYLSYSESFQPNVGIDGNGNVFDPSRGTQYEAGLKYRPEGSQIQVSAAVFEIEQKNVVVNSFLGYSFGSQIDIRSKGIEFEVQGHLSEQLSLIAAYAYTDAKVTRSTAAPGGFGRYLEGSRTAAQPKHSASLWADYNPKAFPELTLSAGIRYKGSTTDFGNTLNIPEYTLADIAVSYTLENWRLSINVKNLTDKTYIASCTYACWYGDKRSVIASITYNW